jgi:endonuclease YncB( thermonuclease family)
VRGNLDAALKFVTTASLGAIAGAAWLWSVQFGPVHISGSAKVIDGDSIKIDGTNIRLAGIDAPELPVWDDKQCRKLLSRHGCFDRSAIALHWLVGGEEVRCWIVGSDALSARGDWDRPLGVCFHGETELNAWMLRNCHAGLPEKREHRVGRYRAVAAERDCSRGGSPLARLDAN